MTPALLIGWLTQAIVVSALLAAAALLLQKLAGRAVPNRLIWSGALFSSLVLVLVAPLRTTPPTLTTVPERVIIGAPIAAAATTSPALWRVALRTWSSNVDRVLTAPVQWSVTTIGGALDRAPVAARVAVTAVWPLSTLLVLIAFGVTYRRHRAELARSERHDIAGVTVHVTDALGPAVIGVRNPRIAVPAWLLERSAHEQRLVITHEQSHIAAHDPLLLLAACLAVALMPWNPIAWFALARLRLAIELDCDRRVLGTGASTRQYGQLLIALSSHVPRFTHGGVARTPLALTSPAFSYHPSHLERRLITMTARPSQFVRSRRIGSGLLATITLLAACESQLPTAAELQNMDVKGAELRVAQVTKLDTTTAIYLVDGKQVSRAEANALSADKIATLNVRGGKTQEIRIVTRGVPLPGAPATMTVSGPAKQPFNGLLLVDGQKMEPSMLNSIKPESIESIDIIKGEAAKAQYGEAGANGVIKVTTKKK
ncbi:MAG: M56 family metallopeptidase [Gemmatimonadota bacterium]|nr:M56 family metallopeptidase [Gemmatimonadota bacterium]